MFLFFQNRIDRVLRPWPGEWFDAKTLILLYTLSIWPLNVRINEGRFTTIFYLLKTCLFAHSSELTKLMYETYPNSFSVKNLREFIHFWGNYHARVKVLKKDFNL